MKKIKCNTCHTNHGGFHLCLGHVELPERKNLTFTRTMGDKASAIQQKTREGNKERDARLAKDYKSGTSMPEMEKKYGLSRTSITKHAKRLGCEMRNYAWRPKEKVNG